jgi:hypothetical protein
VRTLVAEISTTNGLAHRCATKIQHFKVRKGDVLHQKYSSSEYQKISLQEKRVVKTGVEPSLAGL